MKALKMKWFDGQECLAYYQKSHKKAKDDKRWCRRGQVQTRDYTRPLMQKGHIFNCIQDLKRCIKKSTHRPDARLTWVNAVPVPESLH